MEDEPVSIRSAADADMNAVGKLGALLVRIHHDFDPDRFVAAEASTEEAYAAHLSHERLRQEKIVLVAEAPDAGVVGYVYAGMEGTDYMALRGPAGVIYDLVVHPSRRRQGIAARLLEEARLQLAARGASRVVLWTAERNDAAQRLFDSAGFRRTMIEMTWNPPGADNRSTVPGLGVRRGSGRQGQPG